MAEDAQPNGCFREKLPKGQALFLISTGLANFES
jgi:hypothetical protein